MNENIQITIEKRFGMPVAKPINIQAQYLASIANTKEITKTTLDIAKAMGFTIENVNNLTLTDL